MSTAVVERLDDGAWRITVGGRTSTVSSGHLVEERVLQLQRLDWGRPPRLADDIARCHDALCPERENCLCWLERDFGGARTSHHRSLFPYDISIDQPCPMRIPAR